MSNDLPLVSVIVPCYNGAAFVPEILETLHRQSYPALEAIVVDDGSTDGSVDLLRKADGIRLIACPVNRGQAVARNIGMAEAKGDFIHFLDIDDRINSRFYSEMVAALRETGAELACSGMIHQAAPSKTQLFRSRRVVTNLRDRLRVSWVGKWGYSVRYLFPAEFLRDEGLTFEEGRLMEDLPFSFAALSRIRSIVTVPGAEYLYVRNEGSSMQDRSAAAHERRQRDRRHARERVLEIAEAEGIDHIPGVTSDRFAYLFRKLRQRLFGSQQDRLTEEL